ncbi:MAG: hypothetical protein RLZZ445_562 [Pseudomonadota bacterium]|jgi:two-component system OmpR family response regulator
MATVCRSRCGKRVLITSARVALKGRAKFTDGDEQFLIAMNELVRDGYADLAANQLTLSSEFIEFFSESQKKLLESALTQAESEAASGVSTLQRQGYYVRIAMKVTAQVESTGGESVLIVEDDGALAKFPRKCLELEGFSATIAGNRNEIIAGLSRQPQPDLVLLDVMLPDADGFNILMKIREHPTLKTVPVLMLNAKAAREAVFKGLAGGANGYITKPFQPDALIEAVKTVPGISKNPFDRQSHVE